MMKRFLRRHPVLGWFLNKVAKDNVPMLASVVAWSIISSLVLIIAGILAISGLVLRGHPDLQNAVVQHLSQALRGVLSPADLRDIVNLVVQRAGLLALIGFLGALWGGSNIGGAISTVFQPIFQVRGRTFWQEKLLDVAMIFVFTFLLIVVIVGSTIGGLIDTFFKGTPVNDIAVFAIGEAISLLAGFLLFYVAYAVFPNVESRYKVGHIWPGALVAAILFELLSTIWPLYAHFARFARYGAVLVPIVVLGAWIFFFAIILVFGAEVVSIGVLKSAWAQGEPAGPLPNGTVPQRAAVAGEELAAMARDD